MSKLTLEGLEVLDTIDRKGSFAAAAAALYRVPSKITYTVNKMEEELGVSLFRRQGRRSVLTPAGRLLLEQGRELLDAAERLVENTRQLDRGWESTLTIALDSVLELDFLQPHLDALFALQPDIEINVCEEVLGGSWEAIKQERADLVVGAPSVDTAVPGIVIEQLQQVEWVYAVARKHPLAALKRPVSHQELLQHRAVVVRDSSRDLPALSLRVFATQPLIRVATMQQKIDAQRLGLGVGFLPRFRIEDHLASGALQEIQIEEPGPDLPLHMAWRASNKGRALRQLVESLRQSKEP